MEYKYWILTVQKLVRGEFQTETLFYYGNLVMMLMLEQELGSQRNIIYSKEITKEEYEYAMQELKIMEMQKKK